jgi:hypothetical protein
MISLALSRGGRCLSISYRNNATKLRWRCSLGHEWQATPLQIKKGHWCPHCARVATMTFKEMQALAAGRAGYCLSSASVGSSKLVRWKCSLGHEWQARASSVKAGTWCPRCAGNQKLTLEEMQKIARVRGGRCISSVYINGRYPLLWECRLGHRWKASPAKVKDGSRRKGTWCLACYDLRRKFHARQSIERMSAIALSLGGTCISAEYLSSKSKLIWECSRGHRWQALPVSVIHGTWCPVCARNQRLCLSQLQGIAAQRFGRCLSDRYANERSSLRWECAEGHQWAATPGKVKRGTWCPVCARTQRRRAHHFGVATHLRPHVPRIVRKTHPKRTRSGKLWSLPLPVGSNGAGLGSLPKRGTQT